MVVPFWNGGPYKCDVGTPVKRQRILNPVVERYVVPKETDRLIELERVPWTSRVVSFGSIHLSAISVIPGQLWWIPLSRMLFRKAELVAVLRVPIPWSFEKL
jgi:hypothetical protein